MLTVCFDASGKTPSTAPPSKRSKGKPAPDSQVMAVVGFASQSAVWADFDTKWSAVLERYHVDFFHAGDFTFQHGQFKAGWDYQQDQQKRVDFQSELMEVIQECGLRKFGAVSEA